MPRSAHQVGREILTALEAMRPLLDHVPAHARLPLDLTSLGTRSARPTPLGIALWQVVDAFGAQHRVGEGSARRRGHKTPSTRSSDAGMVGKGSRGPAG